VYTLLWREHTSTKGLATGWGSLWLDALLAGKVVQGKSDGTRADTSMFSQRRPVPQKPHISGGDSLPPVNVISNPLMQGFRYTNDMEKIAEGRTVARDVESFYPEI